MKIGDLTELERALTLDHRGRKGCIDLDSEVDALAEFGVTHIEMPATPERIWRAIHSGKT